MANTNKKKKNRPRDSFKCPQCDKTFTVKRYLTKHCARGHQPKTVDDGRLACSMCAKNFAYLSQLRRHQMSHLNVRDQECVHCGAQFVQKTHLQTHIARKHTAEPPAPESGSPPQADHANADPSPPSGPSTESTSGIKKVNCAECGDMFESQWHLKRHRNRRHKKCKCAVCGEQFACSSDLREHTNQHDSSRAFHCSVCQRRFRRSGELQNHEQLHAQEGNFLCVCCNAVFIQRVQLERHMKQAHDVRRSCATCTEHFSSVSQYGSHMRIIHSQSTCAYCGDDDHSMDHRNAKHWRRLDKPRPLTKLFPSKHGQDLDEQPALKMVVLLDEESLREDGLIDVHHKFPPGLLDAFPHLAGLQIRLTDFKLDEAMQSILLSFPLDSEASDDPRVAQFIHSPIYIDFRRSTMPQQ